MKKQSDLLNKRIIITGGPTREYLDPVRFISNASSGKMGAALAGASLNYSNDVVFIHGPIDSGISASVKCRQINVVTNLEMFEAVKENLCENCILIMAAAPTDFKPAVRSDHKIKKSENFVSFDFILNIDILKSVNMHILKKNIKNVFLCGFAAETENFIQNAKVKISKKNLNLICLNDVTEKGSGFDSDTNRVTAIAADGAITEIPMNDKSKVAEAILEIIEKLHGGRDA